MRITRSHPTSHFTVLRNEILEDKSLSFKARGLLAYLLSRPDGWSTDSKELATHGPDGTTAILSALSELESAGYLNRKQTHDAQGHFVSTFEITDTPTVEGKAAPGKPDTGKPVPYTKNGNQELKTPPGPPPRGESEPEALDAFFTADFEEGYVESVRPRKPEPGSDDDPGFTAFWSAYPRHVAKQTARKAWRTAIRGGAVPGEIIAGAEKYRDDYRRRSRGIEYTAHPATWLNGQRWQDHHEVENADRYGYSNNPYEN